MRCRVLQAKFQERVERARSLPQAWSAQLSGAKELISQAPRGLHLGTGTSLHNKIASPALMEFLLVLAEF